MIMNPHEDVHPGSGLTEPVAAALHTIMQCIIPSMFKSQQPWALTPVSASYTWTPLLATAWHAILWKQFARKSMLMCSIGF